MGKPELVFKQTFRRFYQGWAYWDFLLPIPTWARFFLGLCLVAMATYSRYYLLPIKVGAPFLTFYPAFVLSAMFLGTWAGLMVVLVSAVTAHYLFLLPLMRVKPDFYQYQDFSESAFIISGVIVCLILDQMRRNAKEIKEINARLEVALEKAEREERLKDKLLIENREYQLSLEAKVAERTVEIEATRDATIFSMTKLAEFRDLETGGHLERIREYTREIAEHFRKSDKYGRPVDEQFVTDIFKGSPLHDIGKVGIPDAILQKPGPLTLEEFKIMKTHSSIGGATLYEAEQHLKTIGKRSFLKMAKEIAFCHHEKWDGSGYPGGIKGTEIPLAARIMALADVYDALISKRCYKKAWSHKDARVVILNSSGTHFDPEVVEAFKDAEQQFIAIKESFKD